MVTSLIRWYSGTDAQVTECSLKQRTHSRAVARSSSLARVFRRQLACENLGGCRSPGSLSGGASPRQRPTATLSLARRRLARSPGGGLAEFRVSASHFGGGGAPGGSPGLALSSRLLARWPSGSGALPSPAAAALSPRAGSGGADTPWARRAMPQDPGTQLGVREPPLGALAIPSPHPFLPSSALQKLCRRGCGGRTGPRLP